MIETTCNISLESYTKISLASAKHKIQKKKLIACILQECIKIKIQQKMKPGIFTPVRYQHANNIENEWKVIHANIQEHYMSLVLITGNSIKFQYPLFLNGESNI